MFQILTHLLSPNMYSLFHAVIIIGSLNSEPNTFSMVTGTTLVLMAILRGFSIYIDRVFIWRTSLIIWTLIIIFIFISELWSSLLVQPQGSIPILHLILVLTRFLFLIRSSNFQSCDFINFKSLILILFEFFQIKLRILYLSLKIRQLFHKHVILILSSLPLTLPKPLKFNFSENSSGFFLLILRVIFVNKFLLFLYFIILLLIKWFLFVKFLIIIWITFLAIMGTWLFRNLSNQRGGRRLRLLIWPHFI